MCPNRYECVYLHSISKDHEYYYLNNHKNGTEDQRNSLLTVLRKYKKDFNNYTTINSKVDLPKTIFPSLMKIVGDLNKIFFTETNNEEPSIFYLKYN